MQQEGLHIVDNRIRVPRRSKRLNEHVDDAFAMETNVKALGSVKKQRGVKLLPHSVSSIDDKENFHRASRLAPRSRATRVFAELLLDHPTDASDFEISDCEEYPESSIGILFNQQWLRVDDIENERYNFKVFEDSL
jgi:hypothetical protein